MQGIFPVTNNVNRKIFYAFPKGEFAVACFQDANSDNKMDKNLFGIPINIGVSNNKKGIFGKLPKYEIAKVILVDPKTIQIQIN